MVTDQKKKLYEHVFETLKDMIIRGELKPGTKLKEVPLAKKLDTSRTPVRDALRKLEKEGLVVFYPSQGAEVIRLSFSKIQNLFECRAVLEGLAARQAADHVSEEDLDSMEESIFLARRYFEKGQMEKTFEKNTIFHDRIIQLSCNPPLIHMMENIRTQILLYRSFNGSVGFRPSFCDEHLEIYQALARKKASLAETLMRKHILADFENTMDVLKKNNLFTEDS